MTAETKEGLVLIVDDDPVSRLLIESMLRKGGFQDFMVADGGEAALTVMRDRIPNCVVLDVMMPDMDGFEVCRRIRSDPRLSGIPVIIQTALQSRGDREGAFRAGATDVLAKPIEAYELIARVSVHTANRILTARFEDYHRRMESELEEAKVLMAALPPDAAITDELGRLGVRFDAFLRPSSEIGGDYWTAWPLADGRVGFFAGDVSGHGVSAALCAFMLHSLLIPPPVFADSPARLAAHVDRRIHATASKRAQFVAGVVGVIDPAAGSLTYIGGGFRDGFIVRKGPAGQPPVLDAVPLSGMPFGLVADMPRTLKSLPLASGDVLVLYSDAFVETVGDTAAPRDAQSFRQWAAAAIAQGRPSPDRLGQSLAEWFVAEFGSFVMDDMMILSMHVTSAGNG